jgi:poly-gamma-glutamate synthesis protein (capsule biosynthesis protein)
MTEPQVLSLATVGDCIVTRPISQLAVHDASFARILDELRGADATFGNLETAVVDLRDPGVHPWGVPEDWSVRADAACADDLEAMGFDLLGRANNHAVDWGPAGVLATSQRLDEAGLVHAGAGGSASEARAPRYLETPNGRVALVSMTTSPGHDAAAAIDPHGEVPARPGVHTIRVRATATLPPEGMQIVEALRDAYPECDSNWTTPRDPLKETDVFRTRFVAGPGVGVSYEPDREDVAAALKSVRLGSQHADACIAAIHAHQGDNRPENPPAFLRELARELIEHGATVVVISGPHRLAPVELHRGYPIFYGLGNFIWSDMQEPLQRYFYERSRDVIGRSFPDPSRVTDADLQEALNSDSFGDEAYFRAALATTVLRDGAVSEIRIRPVDVGYGMPLTRAGIPRVAPPEVAEQILQNLASMSAPLGTAVSAEDGIGVIRP